MEDFDQMMADLADRLSVFLVSMAFPDLTSKTPSDTLSVGILRVRQGKEAAGGGMEWVNLPAEGTYCARVMREYRQISVSNTHLPEVAACCEHDPAQNYAYLGAPIPALTGGAIGTLSILNFGVRNWSRHDHRDVSHAAQRIGITMAPADLKEQHLGFWKESSRAEEEDYRPS